MAAALALRARRRAFFLAGCEEGGREGGREGGGGMDDELTYKVLTRLQLAGIQATTRIICGHAYTRIGSEGREGGREGHVPGQTMS